MGHGSKIEEGSEQNLRLQWVKVEGVSAYGIDF